MYILHTARQVGTIHTGGRYDGDPEIEGLCSFFKEEAGAVKATKEAASTWKYDSVTLFEGHYSKDEYLREVKEITIFNEDIVRFSLLGKEVLSWNWRDGVAATNKAVDPEMDCLWLIQSSLSTSWGNHPSEVLSASLNYEEALYSFAQSSGVGETQSILGRFSYSNNFDHYDQVVCGDIEGRQTKLFAVEWGRPVLKISQVPLDNSDLEKTIRVRGPVAARIRYKNWWRFN